MEPNEHTPTKKYSPPLISSIEKNSAPIVEKNSAPPVTPTAMVPTELLVSFPNTCSSNWVWKRVAHMVAGQQAPTTAAQDSYLLAGPLGR